MRCGRTGCQLRMRRLNRPRTKLQACLGGEELCGHNFRGQACRDFVYVFSTDGVSHYFVRTGANTEATAIKCEGDSPQIRLDCCVSSFYRYIPSGYFYPRLPMCTR